MAMSVPNFIMSCFKLPKLFYEELEQLMANLYWEQWQEKKKNPMGNWLETCANRKVREAWALRISRILTWQCLQSKSGEL